MNRKILLAVTIIVALVLGVALGRMFGSGKFAGGSAGEDAQREILYWVAPMDANYRRDVPGKSPMGMDLVPVYADEVDGQPGVVTEMDQPTPQPADAGWNLQKRPGAFS